MTTPTLAQLRKLAKRKGVDFGANPHGHEYDIESRGATWRMNIQSENGNYGQLRQDVWLILSALPDAEKAKGGA